MNKQELLKIIEDEVADIVSKKTVKEPEIKSEPKPTKPSASTQTTANLSEEELDEIIFYGGKKPDDE